MKHPSNRLAATFSTRRALQRGKVLFSVAAIATLSACATQPPLDDMRFETVDVEISNAVSAEASTHAAAELSAAKVKMEEAETLNSEGESERAKRLLAEASVHAKLAEVTALNANAQVALNELRATMDLLRQEINQ